MPELDKLPLMMELTDMANLMILRFVLIKVGIPGLRSRPGLAFILSDLACCAILPAARRRRGCASFATPSRLESLNCLHAASRTARALLVAAAKHANCTEK